MKRYRLKGFLRWAFYYEGQAHKVVTEQINPKTNKPIERITRKNTVIYGDWVGASDVPLKKWEDHIAGCRRVEVHMKTPDGGIEVLYTEDNPQKIKIEYLAISGMNDSTPKGKKLPTFIEGIRITSPTQGEKTFKVMEGV